MCTNTSVTLEIGKKKKSFTTNYKVGIVRYKVAINLDLIYYELNLITCLEKLLILRLYSSILRRIRFYSVYHDVFSAISNCNISVTVCLAFVPLRL